MQLFGRDWFIVIHGKAILTKRKLKNFQTTGNIAFLKMMRFDVQQLICLATWGQQNEMKTDILPPEVVVNVLANYLHSQQTEQQRHSSGVCVHVMNVSPIFSLLLALFPEGNMKLVFNCVCMLFAVVYKVYGGFIRVENSRLLLLHTG